MRLRIVMTCLAFYVGAMVNYLLLSFHMRANFHACLDAHKDYPAVCREVYKTWLDLLPGPACAVLAIFVMWVFGRVARRRG